MKLRVLIADDESLARDRLRQLLESEEDIEIVAECGTGVEALRAIRANPPHLVFLDVQMPELDGLQVAKDLEGGQQMPIIVFVTAHDRFVLQAFESKAVDYLLKPFDRERFQKTLARVREILQREGGRRRLEELIGIVTSLHAAPKTVERFTVKSGSRYLFVKPSEIDWIGGAGNYSELHVGSSVHLLRETLSTLEQQLAPGKFLRISRSLLVNVDRVTELRSKSHGDFLVILENGVELQASRNYRDGLVRLMGKTY